MREPEFFRFIYRPMKKLIISSIAVATLSLAFVAPSFASEADAGLVDFGRLVPSTHGQFVELNLSQGMLKFAAKIASFQDSDAADLIGNLRQIRINVVGTDDSNRADTVGKIRALSHKLESEGWTQVATIRDGTGGGDVNVHVKQHGTDDIDGVVVTVLNENGEVVFINVVGNISADKLGVIAEKLGIDQLRNLKLKDIRKQHGKEV